MFTLQKNAIIVFILSSVIQACAFELPGTTAEEIMPAPGSEGEMAISLETLGGLSSDEYQAFNVSFRNNSDRWVRLEQINMAFPQIAKDPEILLGEDLSTYLTSVERRNAIDNHNAGLAAGSLYAIGLVGSAVALSNGDRGLALGGLGLATGSASYSGIKAVLASRDRAQFQSTLPDNHVLKPFSIPPKMALSRWIIVRMPKHLRSEEARVEFNEAGKPTRTFEIKQSAPRPVVRKTASKSQKLK